MACNNLFLEVFLEKNVHSANVGCSGLVNLGIFTCKRMESDPHTTDKNQLQMDHALHG